MAVYLVISFLGIALFGDQVASSVLLNFGQVNYFNPNTGKPYLLSQVIQLAFIVVLLCHIPYIFFTGKESLCLIFDEVNRKSISSVLSAQHPNNFENGEAGSINEAFSPTTKAALADDEDAALKKLAYKDMGTAYYLLCTFTLFIGEMVLACLIQSISILFAFISAFTISALAFWIPGYYYLMSVSKYKSNEQPNLPMVRTAKLLVCLGYFNFALGLASAAQLIIAG
jgi:hypothetical protein